MLSKVMLQKQEWNGEYSPLVASLQLTIKFFLIILMSKKES